MIYITARSSQARDNALDWDKTQSASQFHPSVSTGRTDISKRQIPAWFLQERVRKKKCNTKSKTDKGEQEKIGK